MPYELAAGHLRARRQTGDFVPWWAAGRGCTLSAWLRIDVKPPVHMLKTAKRLADLADSIGGHHG